MVKTMKKAGSKSSKTLVAKSSKTAGSKAEKKDANAKKEKETGSDRNSSSSSTVSLSMSDSIKANLALGAPANANNISPPATSNISNITSLVDNTDGNTNAFSNVELCNITKMEETLNEMVKQFNMLTADYSNLKTSAAGFGTKVSSCQNSVNENYDSIAKILLELVDLKDKCESLETNDAMIVTSITKLQSEVQGLALILQKQIECGNRLEQVSAHNSECIATLTKHTNAAFANLADRITLILHPVRSI